MKLQLKLVKVPINYIVKDINYQKKRFANVILQVCTKFHCF